MENIIGKVFPFFPPTLFLCSSNVVGSAIIQTNIPKCIENCLITDIS